MASEREILDRLRRGNRGRGAGLKLGIGDDCAVYQPRAGEELSFTTDFLIEDVHFRRETHGPRDIGFKALARGLSDLAAMGATPRFCLLSLALPPGTNARYTNGIFRGLLELAGRVSCPLAGGDLAAAPLLLCDIVACGSTPTGTALTRRGAKPGDGIWVSGRLGGSALGLETNKGSARQKHLRPEPRLELGSMLRGKATAAMDLSDGLSIDLARLCRESGVSAEIAEPPRFPGASLEQALHGGEDYELLFTARAETRFPGSYRGVPLTRIGQMAAGRPGRISLNGSPLPALGYDHFR